MTQIHTPKDWSLAVLVGGKGRRLGGRAKGNLTHAGQTLIARTLALAPHFSEVLLVGDDAGAYPEVAARRVADLFPNAGAPAGLVSALCAARTPWALVVACDMPGVTLEAAQALAAKLEATRSAACFLEAGGVLHPFPGLYRSTAGATLRGGFAPGTSVHALLATLAICAVPLPDLPWARQAVANVNTWDDARALSVDDG